MSRRASASPRDEQGFTMILVIGFMLVLSLLAIAVFAVVTGSLRSSTQHQNYDNALNVAEAGVDQTLGRLNQDKTYASGPTAPSSFASDTDERNWARTQLLQIAQTMAAAGTPLPSVADGQYVSMKPSNRNTVYTLSFIPTYAASKKSRLLKAEYIFSPYKPGNALLTQGDLCFSGSVVVNALDGTTPAPVHTNSNLAGSCSSGGGGGSGSLTVTGDVTATGSYTVGGNATVGAGSGGNTETQPIPVLSPRDFYSTNAPQHPYTTTSPYDGDWYDLCPNGQVKPVSTTPCASTTVLGTNNYRGWTFTAASGSGADLWSLTDPGYPGVYYAYHADAYLNTSSNAPYWNGTIVAEPSTPAGSPCNKTGGNISFKTVNIKSFIPGTVMLAGADLGRLQGSSGNKISNSDVGDGLFGAADQVYLDTSSTTITGSIIAGDQCPADSLGRSSVQGVTLKFDQTTEIPISDVVRTVEWLEYVG